MNDIVKRGTNPGDGTGDDLWTAAGKINNRFAQLVSILSGQGEWAPTRYYEAYPARHWVVKDGVGYVAAKNHNSGLDFAADLALGNWLALDVLQMYLDYAGLTGASLIGTLDGRTVQDWIDKAVLVVEEKVATAGQTVVNLTKINYVPGSGLLRFYLNGLLQDDVVAYTETSPTSITTSEPLADGDALKFIINEFSNGTSATQLRMEMWSPATGPNLLGFDARLNYVAGTIGAALNGVCLNVRMFPWLAKCDDTTDDTAAVNAAVLYLANAGGGKLQWPTGKTCKLLGPVYVVSNVDYDLNGCKLVGGGASTGVMFETGYVNAGALVTNVGTAYQSHVIKNAKIHGGYVSDVGKFCNFQNFNMGCAIRDIELYNARQFGAFDACFYAHFETLMHSGGTVDTLPSFHFKSANNNIKLFGVTTTCAWDYHFEGGGTDITMIGCSQEGGVLGIKVTGDMLGLTMIGGYTEAMPGTWLDLSDAGNMTYEIIGRYFNYVDIVVEDSADNFVRMGRWAESNQIVNVGQKTDPLDPLGFVYRGRMQLTNRLNLVEFELNNVLSGSLDIPANWIVGPNTNVSFTSTVQLSSITDFRKKALVSGNLIPLRFSGDTGTALTGYVPFCTITLGTTTHIDTKIKWQPLSLFAKFALRASDGSGLHEIYGDIYCPHIKRHDASAMVMAISDNAGFLRISLTQTAPPFASVTGTVQICQ